jgi:hypothetical protein
MLKVLGDDDDDDDDDAGPVFRGLRQPVARQSLPKKPVKWEIRLVPAPPPTIGSRLRSLPTPVFWTAVLLFCMAVLAMASYLGMRILG